MEDEIITPNGIYQLNKLVTLLEKRRSEIYAKIFR